MTLCLILTGYVSDGLAQTVQELEPYAQQIPGTGVEIEMVPVEGGTFMMGSDPGDPGYSDNEGPSREVAVGSFWMGKYEISWEQYELFSDYIRAELEADMAAAEGDVELSADAISIPTPPYVDMSFGMGKTGFPAISMTNYAAAMYTRWLTAMTGVFHRLPTEAEWEYACRGGTETPWYFGEDASDIDDHAVYADNANRRYGAIGSKEPNPLGLHDMAGNVAEWTLDQYYEDYHERLEGEPADNPWFQPETLYPRTVRGGSWQDGAEEQRCAMRRGSEARWKQLDPQMPKSLWWHTSAPFIGFRVVRPLEQPSEEEMEQYWIEAMQDY